MEETTLLKALEQSAPGIIGIVIVVILFLKAQDKLITQFSTILTSYIEAQKTLAGQWEKLFSSQREALNMMITSIQSLEKIMTSHDSWEREVIDGIQENQQNVITNKLRFARKDRGAK